MSNDNNPVSNSNSLSMYDSDSTEEYREELLKYTDLINDGNFLEKTFETTELAFSVYNAYARQLGFSVRKDQNRKVPGTNFTKNRTFLCSNAGKRDEIYIKQKPRVKEHRLVTRCECEAKLRLTYDFHAQHYVVTCFHRDHSQELVPKSLRTELRSQRKVDTAHLDHAISLRLSGVGTSTVMDHFRTEVGGYENVGFVRRDLYNASDRHRRKEIENGDSNVALTWLEGRKSGDETFYYRYTVDEDNCLDKLFFSDGRSRAEYEKFGDCLLFDATYKTNGYKFPLIILSGVNNHRNSCVFGTTLVQTETTDTYTWVLQTLLEVMDNKMPNSVITDGDKSIHAAIEKVFPNARRRLCNWHLQRNSTVHVKIKKFGGIFTSFAQLDCSTDEFDQRWWRMVDRQGLTDNKWIHDVFNKRKLWAYAYLRGEFFADCNSTQRCESLNAVLKKKYQDTSCTFITFLKNYFSVLESVRVNTIRAERDTNHSTVVATTALPDIELSASKVFTRDIFFRFKEQIEMQGALYHSEILYGLAPNTRVYVIANHSNPGVLRRVSFNSLAIHFECDCLFFNTVGYPCKHIVYGMKCERVIDIPKSCYLLRWTPGISKNLRDKNLTDHTTNNTELARHGYLNSRAMEMIRSAKRTEAATKKVAATMIKLTEYSKKKMEEEYPEGCGDGDDPQNMCNFDVGDPVVARPKGSRIIGKKRAAKHCSYCRCQGHQANNCIKKAEEERRRREAKKPSSFSNNQGNANDASTQNTSSANFNCAGAPSFSGIANSGWGSDRGYGAMGYNNAPASSYHPVFDNYNISQMGYYVPDYSSQNYQINQNTMQHHQMFENTSTSTTNTTALHNFFPDHSLFSSQNNVGSSRKNGRL